MQLPAKTACVLPFLLSLLYTRFAYRRLDPLGSLLFFISMLAFELSVTGLNSYVDTKTNGMPLQFSRRAAKRILIVLWAIAVPAALLLVARAGPVVLACGALCFFVGIVYSFGPAPLSRMPLGEILSGVFEGFLIPFLVVYINAPAGSLVGWSLSGWVLRLSFNLAGIFRLAVLTIPAMLGISNIMLANNICDLAADVRVHRYTLPYYLGVHGSLRLFAADYYAAFAAILLIAAFGILPPYVLAALVTLIFVRKNVLRFRAVQSKRDTFPYSVRNFALMQGVLIAAAGAAALVRI